MFQEVLSIIIKPPFNILLLKTSICRLLQLADFPSILTHVKYSIMQSCSMVYYRYCYNEGALAILRRYTTELPRSSQGAS